MNDQIIAREFIELVKKPPIAVVFLNRPEALNALSVGLMRNLAETLEELDKDDNIGVIVLSGKGRAFAAGADIKEMSGANEDDFISQDRLGNWDRLRSIKKPVIAAVHGFALGGGCELALICDIIIASEDAQFGQPEILIGVMPGAGGTQRLARAVGKYRAMEIALTGRRITAQEAHALGLVNRIVPKEKLLDEAETLALEIAKKPRLAARCIKEAVLAAGQSGLGEGLRRERELFYRLFKTHDKREGMKAFLEKRDPKFKDK